MNKTKFGRVSDRKELPSDLYELFMFHLVEYTQDLHRSVVLKVTNVFSKTSTTPIQNLTTSGWSNKPLTIIVSYKIRQTIP